MNIPRDFVGVNSPPNNSMWVTCLAILFLGTIFLVAVCGGDPEIEMNVTKVVTPYDLVACDDARIWINVTPENEPSANIVLVIDTSFSMKDKYNNIETIDYAKDAAKTFVGLVNFSSNNVSVVSYNSIATLEQNLTNNATAILDSIDGLTVPLEVWRGGTNMGESIRIAQQELDKSTDKSIEVIVLFTDGTATFYGDDVTEDNYKSRWCGNCPVSDTICSDYAKNEAQKSKDNDTTIFTVGFLGGIEGYCGNATAVFSRTLLENIASDDTRYYESPTPEELEEIYCSIYRHIYAATDLIVVEYLSPIFTVLDGCPGDRCTTFPNGTQKIEFEKDILGFDEIWNIQINITTQWAGTFGT
ncbi:MAG: vWA domain-containing protein, partial [Euryarchaeota archaeon]|nr:vWA domain-containing protein [Euryarchaeota archaeon]